MVSRKTCLLFLLLPLLLLFSCRPGEDWIVFRGKQGQGRTSTTLSPPLGIKWQLRLQLDEEDLHSFNPPIVKGDTIYFGSADGNFYALDIESGYMRWVFKTGGPINSVPFADAEHVYFGSGDGKAYALDRETGREIWSYQTNRAVNSTFTKYGNKVVFISDGGAVYFISTEGKLIYSLPNLIWYYFSFQVHNDVMYFAPGPTHRPRSFGTYDIKHHEYTWILDTDQFNATWYSFPAIKDDFLHFSTAAFRGDHLEFGYFAYNKHTGERVWEQYDRSGWEHYQPLDLFSYFRRTLELLDYLAPAVWQDRVIYTSGDSIVRALETDTGKLLWEKQFSFPTSSAPTISGDRVYFGIHGFDELGIKPRLLCISARDGTLLWDMELNGAVLSAPVIAGKWIMFGTDQSYFYILEQLY